MARPKDISQSPPPAHHSVHDFAGLILLAAGLVLFLSLISYNPESASTEFLGSLLSGWQGNYLGGIGQCLAWTAYSTLGSAAYLLCATLLGYGSAKVILPGTRLGSRCLWSLCFIASGACLAHLLNLPLLDATRLHLAGEGGVVGWIIGEAILAHLLGHFGSLTALLLLYLLSLLSMTGVHPREFIASLLQLPPAAVERWKAWRQSRREAHALRQAELPIGPLSKNLGELNDVPKNERKRGTQNRSGSISASAANPRPSTAEDEEPDPKTGERADSSTSQTVPPETLSASVLPVKVDPPRPEPKIIDGTAPPPSAKKEAPTKDKTLDLAPTLSFEGYKLPPIDLLDPVDLNSREAADPEELRSLQRVIVDTLQQFGIGVAEGDITRGPTITRYEVYPDKGVRVDRILALERDIARATRAERINILAPIPGKDTVGIEIANSKKQKVTLRELLESEDFVDTKCKIPIALGKDVYGKTIVADLAAMPHGLVAGTTGSGKSVCINAIIASILHRFTPEDLRFIMIDPKVVEMQMYNTLPHLIFPVVTDPKQVLYVLRRAVMEMERRYAIFAKTGVRNIASFNARPQPKSQRELDAEKGQADLFSRPSNPHQPDTGDSAPKAPLDLAEGTATDFQRQSLDPQPLTPDSTRTEEEPQNESSESATEITADPDPDPESLSAEERITKMTTVRVPRDNELEIPKRMPYIVIIVDELADLMQTAPADVESAIARITQKARAAGIHMIIATQTPRADVITGVIKANVPCRVAFQVASALDSRVILDENGAEKLLGMGDMLYRPPGTSRMVRAQGVLVTDEEVRRLVEYASDQKSPEFEGATLASLEGGDSEDGEAISEEDEELLEKCIEVIRQEKKASTSLFQRRLRLGYTRAARILDILETRGYVGPGEGAKPREILVDPETL
jgi:S-DNA-T family DNA segregation ATPase FtsK/SpoIIIE